MSKIELGATYKDLITGFEGVATGYVVYITGCNQALIVPRAKDGALIEAQWFDEQRLCRVEFAPVIKIDNGTTPGCDRPAPKR